MIVYLSNAPESPEVEQSIIFALENILFDKPYELPVREALPTFVQIPIKRLTAYAGTYALETGEQVYVRTEDSNVYLQVEGQNRFQLLAVSETEFRIKGVVGIVRFEKDNLVIVQGQETVAVRVWDE